MVNRILFCISFVWIDPRILDEVLIFYNSAFFVRHLINLGFPSHLKEVWPCVCRLRQECHRNATDYSSVRPSHFVFLNSDKFLLLTGLRYTN